MKKNSGSIDPIDLIIIAVLLAVAVYFAFTNAPFLVRIVDYFRYSFNFGHASGIANLVLSVLAIFFLTIIAYSSVRMLEIRKREHEHLHHEMVEYALHQREKEEKKSAGQTISRNEKWLAVLTHISLDNENEWKLAIIESDALLYTLLDSLGFAGEGMGDKLKSATQETFPDLTLAWEVHNTRNRIAHEAGYSISHHEAKRITASYEQIFRRFGYI